MFKRVSSFLILSLLLVVAALAQSATYLAIEGEGTASVLLDLPARIAYVTDGGREGIRGINGAKIDKKSVLSYLLEKQINRLVITCSHPHSDHMEGLREMIKDPKIRKFAEIRFIDNEQKPPTKDLLFKEYEKTWKEEDAKTPPEERPAVSYQSTKNKDGFAGLARGNSTVRASSFVYDPSTIGDDVHDQSVISQYEIRDEAGAKSVQIVDFDDSSSKLIAAWAAQEAPRVNVLIASHHGSSHNDLSPILEHKGRFGLRDVVITVNEANKYDHPSPEVLLRLLEDKDLGPDHIFITGAERDNVEITPEGIRTTGSFSQHRQRLASFIEAQIDRHEVIVQEMIQRIRARAAGRVVLPAKLEGAGAKEILQHIDSQNILSKKELSTLRRSVESLGNLQTALGKVSNNKKREPVLALLSRDLGPSTRVTPPGGDGLIPSEEGTENYREIFEESLSRRSGGTGPTPPPASGPPSHPPGGGGVEGGSAPSFGEILEMPIPIWGGIILGNKAHYEGPVPSNLEILELPGSEDGIVLPLMRFTAPDGTTADYTDMTLTELWAAYRFVQPTTVETEEGRWTVPGNAAGLVGMVYPWSKSWVFAIHPAIAGTFLARDAMRLDMLIAVLHDPKASIPAQWRAIPWRNLEYKTYHWYDEAARIQWESGHIKVQPESGLRDCLMRVRLVSFDARSLERDDMEDMTDEQIQAELEKTSKSDFSLNNHLEPVCRSFDALQSIDRLARLIAVLNWYTRLSHKDLPTLPAFVVPLREKVPASWSYDAVLGGNVEKGTKGKVNRPPVSAKKKRQASS